MPDIADLFVILRAETAPFTAGMRTATAEGESFTAKMGGVGAVMSKVGAATLAVGAGVAVVSVKMASDFQSSMVRLKTSAGETGEVVNGKLTGALKQVSDGILSMAGQVGVSANDLAKSMYFVEAAGYHGAGGLTVLKAAAQGAAAEGADTTTVAKALTDVLKDYHLPAEQAGDVTSKMVTAVAHGKVNLQDFSASFANIVPAASAAGVSFNDVGAALSEMTNHGFTAQRASQNLAQALRSLLNPTAPMKKAFGQFGVTTDELSKKLHGPNGLTDAMEYLSQAATKGGKEGTPEYAAALKRLMGTASGANAALATTGENFNDTTGTIKAMAGSTVDAHGKVKGFAEVQQTLGQKVKQLKAGLDTLLIQLGTKLIPIVTSVIDFFTKHKTITEGLAAAIGVVLTAAVVKFATSAITGAVKGVGDLGKELGKAAKAVKAFAESEKLAAAASKIMAAGEAALNAVMDANPVVLIVIAIIALVAAMIYAYNHSARFRAIVQAAFHGVATVALWLWHSVFEPAFHGIATVVGWVVNFIKSHWPLLLAILTGPIGIAVLLIVKYWDKIKDAFVTAYHAVIDTALSLVAWVAGLPARILAALVSLGKSLWHWATDAFTQAKNAATTVAGGLITWVTGIPGRVLAALSSLGSSLWTWATNAFNRAKDAASGVVGNLMSWASGIPGRVLSALGSLGSLLWSAGSDLIWGLIHGVESAADTLFSYIGNIGDSVSGAFKKVLSIFSPSRVFMSHGVNIVAGLVQGLQQAAPTAVGASRDLATATTRGFGSPNLALAGTSVTSAGALALAGGGSGTVVNNNYVTIAPQGSILAERDLRDTVQQQMLQMAGRNSQTWQAYHR
ncbi:phage tail tape measure protein [Streptomyces violascens]|uniref:phage tail tape measure protein n=1 Tax=Streptomyces violascens TaxID=67381 RepID=UPI00369AE2F8